MNYTILRNGQSYGPYSIEDLSRYQASGHVLPTDLAVETTGGEQRMVSEVLGAQGVPPPPPLAALSSGVAYPAGIAGPFPEPKTNDKYPLFPVSVPKFVAMSLCTFGFYHLFWAYKSWSRIQDQTREPMMPWARALFAGIWNFAYFTRVQTRAQGEDVQVGWNPVVLGACIVVLSLTGYAKGGLAALSLLTFLPYLPVVKTVQALNAPYAATTEEEPNSRFTAGNLVVLVIGGLLLLLALLGFAMQMAGMVKG